jgi:3-oxoacyl-[acyl-carrier protein] reductase
LNTLNGVNAIISGATRGVGFAAAHALAAAGANVVINGRSHDACREAVAAIRTGTGSIEYVAGDIADEAVAESLVAQCVDSFGQPTFVLNNAGITRDKSLMKMSVEDFDEVVAVHLRGTWLMCRAAARAMRSQGGGILNVTSGSALFGLIGQSNYAAAKGGIIALTRALSVELARYHIRVNALYPIALTDMTAPVLTLSGDPDGPLRSVFGAPEHVARIVVALACSDSQLTNQILAFDGTELTVWSHPEPLYRIRHVAPWSDSDTASGLSEVAGRPAELHPDAVGVATREALSHPHR